MEEILDYPPERRNWIPLPPVIQLNSTDDVLYNFREEIRHKGICFKDINHIDPKEGEKLEVCLQPYANAYNVKWPNLLKYLEKLNELYSFIFIEPFFMTHNDQDEIWLRVTFQIECSYIILRDICTRVRFLCGGPYNSFINELLENPNFELVDVEKHLVEKSKSNVSMYFNSNHYHYVNWRNKITNYENYEERMLNLISTWGKNNILLGLHNIMNKLTPDEQT